MNNTSSTRLSHARDYSRPGFFIKLILMALINAFGGYGILASAAQQHWGILGFLAVTLIVANWVYFSKRAMPAKYLLPGLVFLAVYQIYVVASTVGIAFTNYGQGHNDAKAPAITQIMKTSDRRIEGTATYPVAVVERDGELGLAVLRDGVVLVGTEDEPLVEVGDAAVSGERITEVPGWRLLSPTDVASKQAEVVALRVSLSDNPEDGWLRTDTAVFAFVAKSSLTYDEATDTFTDAEGKVYQADESQGFFVAEDGTKLMPGWRVYVGFSNFTSIFTMPGLAGPFLSIAGWTFIFALVSVVSTFALGMALAVIYNDARVKGRKFYRAIFLLPYAFPAFLAALTWKGLLNRDFGFINEVLLNGSTIGWLTDPTLAKISVLLVNLWLGFPYTFLVCTGALQAIPAELNEAGVVDGASGWQRFRHITFPMLMVTVGPLAIASFAFNFNNFSLIYMLTGGGPSRPEASVLVGHTDIMISMIFAIAFESGEKQYGLASALTILVFIVVGVISWLGLRQTRKLEELV